MCDLDDFHAWLVKDADKAIRRKPRKYSWKFQYQSMYYWIHMAEVINDGMGMDYFFPFIKIDADYLKDNDLKVDWSTILVW